MNARLSVFMLMSFLFMITLGCQSYSVSETGEADLTNLATEYADRPIGLDIEAPRFSWQMEAPAGEYGYSQTAYRIIVSDEAGSVVWNSDRVESDLSVSIEYEGLPLEATTIYDWDLTVWNQNGETLSRSSQFETGLMNSDPNLTAWDGATWIGGGSDDVVFYSHYLSVYKMQYTVQLEESSGSTRAGIVFGANDSRLMNQYKNMLRMESGRDESYIEVELDISGVDGSEEGHALLNIYRVGYHPADDPDVPLFSIPISDSLINADNRYKPHDIYLESEFGEFGIYMDGTEEANQLYIVDADGDEEDEFNLNPVGSGNNYISYPLMADIGFSVDANQTATFENFIIRHFRLPSNPLFEENLTGSDYNGIFVSESGMAGSGLSVENGAYVVDGGNSGVLIVADPSRNSMPMLRTEFSVASQDIEKARLYVTARGIYEMYINGERVGDYILSPGVTQYNRTHMYQTYDVTDMISEGDNAMGAWLGQGWWSGNSTYTGSNWNFFGDRQSLLGKLVITYADGTSDVITTNPDTWTYYDEGPIIYGSFMQGEVYDATRDAAIEGWSTARYDDSMWEDAVEVPLEGTAYRGPGTEFEGNTETFNYDSLSIIGQLGENPEIELTISPKSVEQVRPGVFVYDMGQNMVGFPRIELGNGTAGDTVILRYAEVLYPDLEEYGDNVGMIMLENIRAALVQDKYIRKGGNETIQPRFTFHGYRYLEITGIDEALPLDAIEGLVISSADDLASHYETSNDLVNRFWENIVWSFRGNFISIPTDCPQRNERMGWGGDISVFSETATYLGDVSQFLRRHMLALRDLQNEEGRFPNIAPVGGGFGGTLWGSAGIVAAWESYLQFGDEAMLREHYGAMRDYVDYLDSRIDEETGVLMEGPLGDWLSPVGNKNDNSLLWTAYQIYDLEIVARSAEILGRQDEVEYYWDRYAERKAFFNETYVDSETGKTIHSGVAFGGFGGGGSAEPGTLVDTQVSYAVPLNLGVFSEENMPAAIENLGTTVSRVNIDDSGVARPWYSLMVGFIGVASINDALSEYGNHEAAYRLLQQDSYPSWLYPVLNGATTIWERLNSYTVEEGFGGNNSMNSFNHYSFGSVGAWMYNYSLGIQRSEEAVAFKHFDLKPSPDPTGVMEWASGYYDSMYGRIKSEWHVEDGQLIYKTTVPANTTATLYLPADSESDVAEGSQLAYDAEGIEFVGLENGKAVYDLVSGSYEFSLPYVPFEGAYR